MDVFDTLDEEQKRDIFDELETPKEPDLSKASDIFVGVPDVPTGVEYLKPPPLPAALEPVAAGTLPRPPEVPPMNLATDVTTQLTPQVARRGILAAEREKEVQEGAVFEKLAGGFGDVEQVVSGLAHPIKQAEKVIESATSGRLTLSIPGSGMRLSEQLETPIAAKPELAPATTPVGKIGAGMAQSAIDFIWPLFTTPEGVATLGIAALPKQAQRAIAGAFATQMAVESPQALNRAATALQVGDLQTAAREATSGTGGAILSAVLARHAAFPRPGKPTGIKPTEPAVEPAAKVEPEVKLTKAQQIIDPKPLPDKKLSEPELTLRETQQVPNKADAESMPNLYKPTGEKSGTGKDIVRVCGYCEGEYKATGTYPPNVAPSHGFCDRHAVQVRMMAGQTLEEAAAKIRKVNKEQGPNVPDWRKVLGPIETKGPEYAKEQIEAAGAVPAVERVTALTRPESEAQAGIALRRGEGERPAQPQVPLSTGLEALARKAADPNAPRFTSEELSQLPKAGTSTHEVFLNRVEELSKAKVQEQWAARAPIETPPPLEVQGEVPAEPPQAMASKAGIAETPVAAGVKPAISETKPIGEVSQPKPVSTPVNPIGELGVAEPIIKPGMELQAGINIGAAIDTMRDFLDEASPRLKAVLAQISGRSAPRTSAASTRSGNALVRYASARVASPAVAKSMATDVLGSHYQDPQFGKQLGAVLVEDRLRAIRRDMTAAGDPNAANVETVIGKPWSPFQTEADFRRALNDPEIKAAIDRHKATVQRRAEEAHEATGGELAGAGMHTGAFVNLKALLPDAGEEVFGQGGRGNLENPLRRISKFFRQAKGTGERYEIDYRTLGERMIRANFEEVAKRDMYKQLVQDGLAVITDPGAPRPEIGGKPAKFIFNIERKGVPAGGGKARTYIKKFWIRPDLASELIEAVDVKGKVSRAGLVTAAHILNRIQLAGPTDAIWHTANMIGSIAGSQGGRTVLADLARKLPGVNLADAIVRTTASSIRVMRDSPEIQRQLAQLAEIGAMRGQHPANWMGNMIQFIDRAGRLVRDDMYQNLVRRGLVTASETTRREWVNQMGQYNGRLMGQFQRFFKEAGFSPFIVAGRNFNRMAMRRLFLSPGIEASSKTAALEMKAIEAFGTIATIIAVPALINYALTGKPQGRPGIKMGQIDTGRDDREGKAIAIDPAQWTGLRRGLRISGTQALVEGLKRGQGAKQIRRAMFRDIMGGILHPWTGPAITAGVVGTTGYTPGQYKESEDPSDPAQNFITALEQLNPVAKAIIKSHEKDTPVLPKTGKEALEKTGAAGAELGKSFGGAAGIKTVRLASAKDQLTDLHSAWMRTHPNKKIQADYEKRQKESFISDYKDLDAAITKNDEAAAVRSIVKLLEIKSPKAIVERMSPFYAESSLHVAGDKKPLFQGSMMTEGKFYRTLTPEQKQIYRQAQDERYDHYRKFLGFFRKAKAQMREQP